MTVNTVQTRIKVTPLITPRRNYGRFVLAQTKAQSANLATVNTATVTGSSGLHCTHHVYQTAEAVFIDRYSY